MRWKPTIKSYFIFNETHCGDNNFPWTSSLLCFFFDSLLETSLWSWAQFNFIVHREPPSGCGCQSCLLAIGHLQEHSEPHNSTLHNGRCYVNYARPLPLHDPDELCMKWLEYLWGGVIREAERPTAVIPCISTHGTALVQSKCLDWTVFFNEMTKVTAYMCTSASIHPSIRTPGQSVYIFIHLSLFQCWQLCKI